MSAHHQPATWAAGPMAGPQSPWQVEASTPLQALLESPTCPPPLRHALQTTLTWQFRCETPLRQVLASPRVAPQFVAALLACGALAAMRGEREGTREPVEALLEAGHGGHVRSLVVPALAGVRWGEAHVARAAADEPIVAAWATVAFNGQHVRQARLALTGVWDVPARLARTVDLLVGGPVDEARICTVAEAVEAEATPTGDYLGSLEYRRAMAGVLTRRALLACLGAAGGGR